MRCACPACGRRTDIDADTGDFPTPCRSCGAMMRPPSQFPGEKPQKALRRRALLSEASGPIQRSRQGTLAGILTFRPASDEAPVIIHGSGGGAAVAIAPPAGARLLKSESLREVTRVQERQKALRRAELRGNLQALRALATVGLTLVAFLTLSVVALELRSVWKHPRSSRADVLHISDHAQTPR